MLSGQNTVMFHSDWGSFASTTLPKSKSQTSGNVQSCQKCRIIAVAATFYILYASVLYFDCLNRFACLRFATVAFYMDFDKASSTIPIRRHTHSLSQAHRHSHRHRHSHSHRRHRHSDGTGTTTAQTQGAVAGPGQGQGRGRAVVVAVASLTVTDVTVSDCDSAAGVTTVV